MTVTPALTPPPGGLSEAEALGRRRAGRGNDVAIPQGRTYREILLRNAVTPLYGVLLAVAVLLLFADLPLDALFTAGPIVVYVGVGVFQEVRAKRQLDQISLLARPRVRLVRDGTLRVADPAEVVEGDLLVLEAGDQVPLDVVVIEGELEVDESLLTGESDYLLRVTGATLLSGTVIGAGRATCRVIRVGLASYANQLVLEARRWRDESTPLQRDVNRATGLIVGLVLLVSLPVVANLVLHGTLIGSPESVRVAAVLVSLVPQGLAMMIMVTYTLGAVRIATRGAVVQRLSAIEAMARVDTLCVDKTGTMTTRRMELVAFEPMAPVGEDEGWLRRLAGAVVASASTGTPSGEAIRRALPADPQPVLEELPFRSGRRWSALRLGGAFSGAYLLGATDALAASLTDAQRARVVARAGELAARGLRVLLLARGVEVGSFRGADGEARLPARLDALAIIGLAEEMRPRAADTLRDFSRAGVDLRVLSGDDPLTVGAVASSVGLRGADTPLGGDALAPLTDESLAAAVAEARVVGRVDPETKARIIDALRHRGRFVAMLGDGVNDILAMKRAQLGIALGSGTSAARGVSDLVLLHDDFDLLPATVQEGRRIVTGMQATLDLLLARTGYLLVLLLAAGLLGLPFPFTPRTNAAFALLTVGLPTVILALWVPPARAPRDMLRATAGFAIPAALAVVAICLPIYAGVTHLPVGVARTVLAGTAILCGIGLLSLLPSGLAPRDWRLWALIGGLLALLAVFLAVPFVREVFELERLPAEAWLALAALATAWTLALHAGRRVGGRWLARASLRLRRWRGAAGAGPG